eukprot:2209404-Alexandrium_andersonii.AAC.1
MLRAAGAVSVAVRAVRGGGATCGPEAPPPHMLRPPRGNLRSPPLRLSGSLPASASQCGVHRRRGTGAGEVFSHEGSVDMQVGRHEPLPPQ